jgi:hypothetical protein
MQTARERSPRVDWEQLGKYFHACAFVRSREEEYDLIAPFVRDGLDAGEKAVHITDPRLRDDHLERLGALGMETEGPRGTGQLEVLTWNDAYLRGGYFDAREMLDLLEAVLVEAKQDGFRRTRIVGHMEWALEDRPGVDQLLEYEARANEVLAGHQQLAVCVYDVTRFGAELMVDVLRTHPMVLINGALYENPFFVPPAEFLKELHERNGR